MAAKRTRRSAATWRELLERQRSSGSSVTAFCEREGLARGVFHHWRAKLMAATAIASEPTSMSETRPTAMPFMEIGALMGAPCTIRLEMGSGIVLTIQRG